MNGATCNFCGKSFRNRQAVRAHLKGCQNYRRVPKATVPSVGSKPSPSGMRDPHPATRPTLASGPGQARVRHYPPRLATGTSNPPNTAGLGRFNHSVGEEQGDRFLVVVEPHDPI